MLETSKDILYLVIAFCVLWVTVFLCWMFYYLARILKNASQIIEEFRARLQSLSETILHVKNKVEQMSYILTAATSGLGGLVKKMAVKKVKKFVENSADKLDLAAKEAVGKAMKSTGAGKKGKKE